MIATLILIAWLILARIAYPFNKRYWFESKVRDQRRWKDRVHVQWTNEDMVLSVTLSFFLWWFILAYVVYTKYIEDPITDWFQKTSKF